MNQDVPEIPASVMNILILGVFRLFTDYTVSFEQDRESGLVMSFRMFFQDGINFHFQTDPDDHTYSVAIESWEEIEHYQGKGYSRAQTTKLFWSPISEQSYKTALQKLMDVAETIDVDNIIDNRDDNET